MKRAFLIGFLLLVLISCSQDSTLPVEELPGRVQESFNRHFPDATRTEWISYNLDYQANFKVQDTEFYALFDKNGELYIYRQQIATAHIDQQILRKVKATYPDYSIEEMYKIQDREKLMYKFEMTNNISKTQSVYFMDGEVFKP